jgi:hypothetical protein
MRATLLIALLSGACGAHADPVTPPAANPTLWLASFPPFVIVPAFPPQ